MISIRPEALADIPHVRKINETAFGQPSEAGIVDALRTSCPEAISLVAESDGDVIGHILFSPVFVEGEAQTIQGMGLAPMAVLPEHQRQGIGSKLVQAGLEILRRNDCPFVIVLGHPEYYPRFGFKPASQFGLTCQWDGIPDEVFMVIVFDEAVMAGVSGVAKYRNEFDAAM
ncbi:GNAT family N-acetyltransferase [Candidatus Eisenbacteria bacterium]|uniref:GNAT family N-acetyltransferase n=1 Tax=Eiseniibacteriota bacterium TaxID=2212470 RepID=A0ABV6YIM3_UNCEI